MDDRIHVGTRLEDLAVQIPLAVDPTAIGVHRLAGLDIKLEKVLDCHQRGRHRARHEEPPRRTGGAHADMPEAVEHDLVDENSIGGDRLGEKLGRYVVH